MAARRARRAAAAGAPPRSPCGWRSRWRWCSPPAAAVALAAFAYGRQAAQQAYDRLLIGAADQIAGSVSIRDGAVVVDIPASAFELLSLAPDDRILYAVFDPDGRLVTGYDVVDRPAASPGFADRRLRRRAGAARVRVSRPLRRARLHRRRRRGRRPDDPRPRRARPRDHPQRAPVVGLLGLLMTGLAAFAIRSALAPLRRIEAGLAAREPRDLTPLDVAVPREIGAARRRRSTASWRARRGSSRSCAT